MNNKPNLPEEVVDYIAIMHNILNEDEEVYTSIFGHEFVDEDTFWNLFETKSMLNWTETGDPALTPDQFKEVQLQTVKLAMEVSFDKLKELGLVEESEEGFKITPEGIEAFNRAKEEK